MKKLSDLKSIKRNCGSLTRRRFAQYSNELIDKEFDPGRRLLFGIELEIGPYGNNLAQEIKKRMGSVVAIHHDSGAVEVDSPPMTYSDSLIYLDTLLGKPLEYAQEVQADNWGMHIHVNSAACYGEHLHRVLKILCDKSSRKMMSILADRPVTTGYGEIPSLSDLQRACSSSATVYRIIKGKIYTQPKNVVGAAWLFNQPCSGRKAVYINTRHNTHEFRFFRSTTSAQRAKANLQMLRSLIDFTKKSEGVKEWLMYVSGNSKRYPQLYSLLTTKKLLSTK